MSGSEGFADGFAARVREMRLARGWTLEELADRAGLHRTTLGLVERGRRRLTLSSAKSLALALDEPLWQIVRSVEEPSGPPAH